MNNLLSKIKKGPTKLPPKIMLIGVEGVGKSTAGASMPNPDFLFRLEIKCCYQSKFAF